MVNAYILAFGSLLLMFWSGRGPVRRRRMFIAGATLFASGTLRTTAANPTMLIAGHIIQAADAAALSPAAISLLLLTLPVQRGPEPGASGGAASGLGGATGIFLGGVLAGTFRWSSVFLITVPVSVAASSSPGRCSRRERAAPAAGSTGAARRPPPGQPAAKSMSSVSLDGRTCARLQ